MLVVVALSTRTFNLDVSDTPLVTVLRRIIICGAPMLVKVPSPP
jgi:hypothetical protein